MRIVSYYRQGRHECGLAGPDGAIHGLPARSVDPRGPQHTLLRLLALDRAERARVETGALAAAPLDPRPPLGPAVPAPPLYIYNHGNAPTIFKRQSGGAAAWELPRVPHLRVRPWSCLAGHPHAAAIPAGSVSYGTELGVVLGKEARGVSPRQAADCIAGIVPLNDGFFHIHGPYDTNTRERSHKVHVHAIDTLGKSCDGAGGVGPAVVTDDELERDLRSRIGAVRLQQMREATGKLAWLYDLLSSNYLDGAGCDRSHTGATLLDAEHLISLLSRSLTLPPGTIVGLGAAGWDGQPADLGAAPGSSRVLGTEVESYGRMELTVTRVAQPAAASPLLARRTELGLTDLPADRPPSVWVLRGNYRQAGAEEGIPGWVGISPYLFPSGTVAPAEAPLVLPQHAGRITVSAQLGAVIGTPLFHAQGAAAERAIAGYVVLLQVADLSLLDHLGAPTDYEARSCWFLARCADGFCRFSDPASVAAPLDRLKIITSLTADGVSRSISAGGSQYRHGFAAVLEMMSLGMTLLPGDVISLGQPGPSIQVPADFPLRDAIVAGEIPGVGRVTAPVQDLRSLEGQNANTASLWPARP